MNKGERLFYIRTGNSTSIIPSEKMAEDLLEQRQKVAINNGHSSVEIPGETFQKIGSKSIQEQQRIKQVLHHTLQDASKITNDTSVYYAFSSRVSPGSKELFKSMDVRSLFKMRP